MSNSETEKLNRDDVLKQQPIIQIPRPDIDVTTENRQSVEPKQVIVVRKDLEMPAGKLAAQVAHASLGAFFKLGQINDIGGHTIMQFGLAKNTAGDLWVTERFTKIVLYVKSEKELLQVAKKAEEAGLPTAVIKDAGFTVFNGQPTYTCVGIGPAFPDEFIGITDKLRVF